MRTITGVILLCLAFGGVALAAAIFGVSKSAIHEIEALIGILISAVAVGALHVGSSKP